jgi:methylthioribose-1-phosphate isomerase
MQADLQVAHDQLAASRPTAVNLFWALKRIAKLVHGRTWGSVDELRVALLNEAQCVADEDVEVNKRMGAFGAALVPDKATINTHCNAGSLATVFWGTALGVVRSAWEQGKDIHVFVDETRPRLHGARLTAWELNQLGIPHTVFSDGASGHNMRRRGVDLCLVGSDRIAANGDVANKIGTYNLAVVARENGVPFYVVAPWSTVDMSLMHGDLIPIEERSEDEVALVEGARLTPEGSPAGNPAFDVTPNYLVSGIVTEYGVLRQPYAVSLRKLADQIEASAG